VQAKGARVRLDWLHTLNTHPADDDAAFYPEDLKIAHITASAKGSKEDVPGRQVRPKSGRNQSIPDQGWGSWPHCWPIRWRGGQIVWVAAHYTSQACALALLRTRPTGIGKVSTVSLADSRRMPI